MNIEEMVAELTLEEKAGLCSGRDFWHTKSVERKGIPCVMMCDGPNGLRKQVGTGDHLGINESIQTVCYPTASALAASFDRELLTALGDALGRECQAEDVGMLLGPGLNMKRSPLCGRNFEYFSEDPYLTGELAVAYIQGLQGQGVAACVKHFAANNQETRRMSGNSQVDERTLHEIYLPAFEAAVKKGKTRSVMCAYNALNGCYAAENKALLTDILRKQWGFDGFVVTDWGAVKDRVKGLLAGLDLEMPGGPGSQDAKIVVAVKSGELDERVLDEAVGHILRFVSDYEKNRRSDAEIDRDACGELSQSLAEQCAVLLKNEDALPVKETDRLAFIGEFAKKPRYQGSGSSHINVVHAVSAWEAAEGRNVSYAQGYDAHNSQTDEALLAQAAAAAKMSDTAVIFAGLPDDFETEGCDRDTMSLPDNQNALISAVAAVQPNTVVVLHGGAPMELPWLGQVKAVLCMYLGGDHVGAATVRLLYGEESPAGRLAESWPVKLEDNPSYLNFPGENGQVEYREGVFIGYRYYDKKKMDVLFPFGHGLSYTQFAYSDLCLDQQEMTDSDTLTVSCKIKNVGSREGKEVVQLYIRNASGTVSRPVRELRGFEKVALKPGEEKTVHFSLDKRAFAYYEPKLHNWKVETGEYRVEIGSSSRNIILCGKVQVRSTQEVPVLFTRYTTLGELMTTQKGRALISRLVGENAHAAAENGEKGMGEGGKKMMQQMMLDMPLGSAVNFGRMTEEQLQGILMMLNESDEKE